MAGVAYDWWSNVKEFTKQHSDPRTQEWMFVESPVPFIILTICYLYFVCKAGPQYMKDRKPYDLKLIITIYNIFQIVSCIYLLYGLSTSGSFSPFQCVLEGNKPYSKTYEAAKLIWWTAMLKLTEYLETVFFVLRKKQNQVSGLHLYHHTSTLLCGWIGSKYGPVAVVVPPVVINSFIHILMYSYYLVALHGGKELQKKIGYWKRFLTILQMVQFTLMILHLFTGLQSHCTDPKVFPILLLINVLINFFMFYRFYKKSYTKAKAI